MGLSETKSQVSFPLPKVKSPLFFQLFFPFLLCTGVIHSEQQRLLGIYLLFILLFPQGTEQPPALRRMKGTLAPAIQQNVLLYHLLLQQGCRRTKNSRELLSFPTLQAALLQLFCLFLLQPRCTFNRQMLEQDLKKKELLPPSSLVSFSVFPVVVLRMCWVPLPWGLDHAWLMLQSSAS